eukprot:8731118-Lingulodinium_polyedra.AAC.1
MKTPPFSTSMGAFEDVDMTGFFEEAALTWPRRQQEKDKEKEKEKMHLASSWGVVGDENTHL